MEEISNIIVSIGIVVTGIFSFFVWQATSETAKVAKATLKLNEDLAAKEEKREVEFKRIMRGQLLPQILRDSEKAYNAVVGIDPMQVFRNLKSAPEKLRIQAKDLASYFNEDEVKVITKAWETYSDYRRKYFKDVYPGNEINILIEKADPVIYDFNHLLNTLKN